MKKTINKLITWFVDWFYFNNESIEVEKDTITDDIIKINYVINSVKTQSQYESCRRYINLLPSKYYYDGETVSPSKRDRTLGVYLISLDACKKLTETLDLHYEKILHQMGKCSCSNCTSSNYIDLS